MFTPRQTTKDHREKQNKPTLQPVQTAMDLFIDKRNDMRLQIKSMIMLDEPAYTNLCLPLLNRFALYCQQLPDSSNTYYTQLGGLLDYALNRTEAALALFSQFVLLDDNQQWSEEQKLWQYALFSAALLQGIGKLYLDYKIDTYDTKSSFLKAWNPLLDNPLSTGKYSYEFAKEADKSLRGRINLLTARVIMPGAGLSWLSSNLEVFQVWLALLDEDFEEAGTLGALLIRADALAIQRFLQHFLQDEEIKKPVRIRARTFNEEVSPQQKIDQQAGAEFINWLMKSLSTGEISLNQASLFLVPEGLLLLPELFKLFIKEHPNFKNWLAIQRGLLTLGLHQTKMGKDQNFQFQTKDNLALHSGIVIKDYAVMLPEKLSLFEVQTKRSAMISAAQLIHAASAYTHLSPATLQNAAAKTSAMLKVLSATGQWVAQPPTELNANKNLFKHV